MTRARVPAVLSPQTAQPLLDGTIGDQLRRQAARLADRPALVWAPQGALDTIQTLTYRELLHAVESAAADIARHAQAGDRVALWAANSPEWVVIELASALAGTVLTPFNTAWTDDEVEHALSLTSPQALYVGPDNRGVDLSPRASDLVASTDGCVTIDIDSVSTHPDPVTFDCPRVLPDDAFLIQFTSGTTGRAKGATLSHRAALNAGFIRAKTIGADETDVWLNPIPLHHVGGSVVIVLGALASGGCYVVMPRFDPVAQVAIMRVTGTTRTGGVPTMFYALLDTSAGDEAMSSVRSVGLGGTSVPPSLVERIQSYGATVSLAYAQSECPMVTQSDPAGDAAHVATTVGVPVPHTELRIVGSDGRIAPRGEVGEVCVRSPLTMLGYWDMPEATSEVFDDEGFLHTGDLGSIDDHGVVRIHGRAREVIIRGGENVYPFEVEDVLLRHPAVSAAAVIAAPSERWGEEVAAVVQLTKPDAATPDELMAHAAKTLAHFKVPRHWRFVDAFPMTASGKIRKVDLPALLTNGST